MAKTTTTRYVIEVKTSSRSSYNFFSGTYGFLDDANNKLRELRKKYYDFGLKFRLVRLQDSREVIG